MQLALRSLAIFALLALLVESRAVHRHHHKRSHHHHNLVPQPKNLDPSKMSGQELADLFGRLADYVRSATDLNSSATERATYSENYENERRRFKKEKKASDAFAIASSLALKNL